MRSSAPNSKMFCHRLGSRAMMDIAGIRVSRGKQQGREKENEIVTSDDVMESRWDECII